MSFSDVERALSVIREDGFRHVHRFCLVEVLWQAADRISPLVSACGPSGSGSSRVEPEVVLASRDVGPCCGLQLVQRYKDLTNAVEDSGARAP